MRTTKFQNKDFDSLRKNEINTPSIKQNLRIAENSITFKASQICIISCAEKCREVGKEKT
jgi:hypothetical protein